VTVISACDINFLSDKVRGSLKSEDLLRYIIESG